MKSGERGFIKFILVGLTLFFAASVVYVLSGMMPQLSGQTTDEIESKVEVKKSSGPAKYEWIFTSLGTDDMGTPKTILGLKTQTRAYEVGEFEGSCAEQKADLLPGEKVKVVCWWAGGGKEIGIFNEAGKDVLKIGDVGEGDAETAGSRGNFVTKFGL